MSRAPLLFVGAAGGLLALHVKRQSEANRKTAARAAEIEAQRRTAPARPPFVRRVPSSSAGRYPTGFPIPASTAVIKKPFGTPQQAEAVLRGLGLVPVPLTTGKPGNEQNDNWARDMATRAATERTRAAANAMIVQAESLPQIAFLADLAGASLWVMPL